MSGARGHGWQTIRDEVLRRIHARDWPPGSLIPNEADLAQEFGCARATVNRALRALAEAGLLERRRKAGTRVALLPVSRAMVDIPVIRQEVTERGQSYGYRRLSRTLVPPPPPVAARLQIAPGARALHVTALHLADTRPFVHETRWINLDTVPAAAAQGFEQVSANEWLLAHVPYTHGDIAITAEPASDEAAAGLDIMPGTPLLMIERLSWDGPRPITLARLCHAPGHALVTRFGETG